MATEDGGGRWAPGTHLFILRLWLEDLGGGRSDWRGKIQHVNSGEARYFREWPTLEAFVEGLMLKTSPAGDNSTEDT